MAQQQPPIPNIIHGMQAYNAHQQQLTTELSFCANYDVAQTQQQLANLTQLVVDWRAMMSAQFWNMKAQMRNLRVHRATDALVVMRSVESNPNPLVPINQAIPNFPGTPDHVSRMTALQCRDLLTSLDEHIPQGPQVGTRQLRTAVREAVGLPKGLYIGN